MILYELCNEFLGYITFFTLMNFCIGKNLGWLLGWLVLRDIDNKSKNQLYGRFQIEPQYFIFISGTHSPLGDFLLFLFCYIKGCCLSCTLNGLLPTRGFVLSCIGHLVNIGSLSHVDFMLMDFFLKKYQNVTFVSIPTDLRNLKYSEPLQLTVVDTGFQKFNFLSKLKFFQWQHWWHLKDRLSSFLRKCLPDSPA